MDRDRSWMYSRLQDGFITSDYFNGVEDFISFAFSQHNFLRGSKIRCPCTSCQNNKWQIADDVRKHLFLKGFCYGYTTWTLHGEQEIGESSQNQVEDEPMCQVQNENPYARMVMDAALGSFDFDANQGSEPRVEGESPNPSASSFYSLLQDADEPLWSGCLSHTKLSAVSQLLNCKAEFNMSESCFNRLITVVKSMMPTDECLPEDFYRMKKKLTKLGLGLKTTRTSVYGFGSRVDSRQLFSAPSTGPSTSDSACGPFTYQSFTTNELILQNQLAEKVENLESTVLGIQQGQAGLQSKLS